MKKPYTKPTLKLKGFYASEKIAAPVPTPPGNLNDMGLDPSVSNSITSYVTTSLGSANSLEASPSPSPIPQS